MKLIDFLKISFLGLKKGKKEKFIIELGGWVIL